MVLDEKKKAIIQAIAACNLNVSKAAKKLNYHRNSVVYHVEQIEKKTGLDPLRFYDMIELLKENKLYVKRK